ncbi:MAG: DUF6781 family protein [Gammaproteobacteria bacterium]
MSESKAPPGGAEAPARGENQAIRERVRGLTAELLERGRLDTEGVTEVMRAMTGGAVFEAEIPSAEARQALSEAIKELDQALLKSANAAHFALEQLAQKGGEFSDNDLKEALARLRKLQEDFVATANRLSEAASGGLQRELVELATHVQRVGADAGARVATVVNEFASRLGSSYRESTTSGLEAAREYSARMAFLVSGVLAGVADALREHPETKTDG